MKCLTCEQEVETERLEVLPETKCCSVCAKKKNLPRPMGVIHYAHKTGGTLQVVSPEQFAQHRYYNPYGRNTGRGSGVHRVSRSRQ